MRSGNRIQEENRDDRGQEERDFRSSNEGHVERCADHRERDEQERALRSDGSGLELPYDEGESDEAQETRTQGGDVERRRAPDALGQGFVGARIPP